MEMGHSFHAYKGRKNPESGKNYYHVKISAGNDRYHKQANDGEFKNSNHCYGNAADLVVTPATPENLDEVERILQKFVVANIYKIDGELKSFFRYKNEYVGGLSANPGNEHFHISYAGDDGTTSDGKKELAFAKKRNAETGDDRLFGRGSATWAIHDPINMFGLQPIKDALGVVSGRGEDTVVMGVDGFTVLS